MRRAVLIVIVSLLLAAGVWAQTDPATQDAASKVLAEANNLSQQAVALYKEKKYFEAVSLEKRALAIREEALGPNHELVAASLNNLGAITLAEHHYDEAELYYNRLLPLLEKRWGNDARQLINPIEGLALTRFTLGKFVESEELYLRSLAIKEKNLGPDTLEMSQSLEILGALYERTEKYEKAVDFYKRSLAIREKLVGSADNQIANLLHKCACSLIRAKEFGEAWKYTQRAEKTSPSNPLGQEVGVIDDKVIFKVRPEYPIDALRVGARGSVVVKVLVDECGRVLTAKALSGHQALAVAAVRAALGFRFTPTEMGGRRVKIRGTVVFNFVR